MNQGRLVLEALTVTIARSPIVVGRRGIGLPPGYDDVDIAVLEWIAVQAQRVGRAIPLM